ncbi:carbohydrate ABC transporter permease [Paenibacillus thalictri]|uniref:Carbohydrate ABC transporter permease n=1 Tax=Paenibacillus thalictri TaxID=2527873 RepID=A0A4Q9DQ39_9BACL|nr:carbohydrate ABC transporter permease [Paenibacillus thalictri]TBL78518.1 carbohydrate ABC transporter permease [Paenibacillus thalictri]
MNRDATKLGRLVDCANLAFLSLVGVMTVLPFAYIVVSSFSATEALIPTVFTLDGYRYIFSTKTLLRGLGVSIYITVVGTLLNLLFTSLMAYPLARKTLVGRSPLLLLVLFTMLFSGGMIPTYFIVKGVGLIDSLWALMLPGAISAFNLIVLKNFFQQIPDGLEESAKIDGANDLQILTRIVLPLSLPAMATFSLFYAVGHWNAYFNAVLYLNDAAKWPVQVLLRQIVILSQGNIGDSTQMDQDAVIQPQSVKMAVVVISTIPIMLVYPFLQKHFAKGVLLGSVKG